MLKLVYLFSRHDDLSFAVAMELHAVGHHGRRVDQDAGHLGFHGDVQVGPEPRRPDEGLRRRAPSSSPQRA